MVGLGGLEPPTSRLSSARSNQLSYKPGRKKKSTPARAVNADRDARLPYPQIRKRDEGGAIPQMRPDWPLDSEPDNKPFDQGKPKSLVNVSESRKEVIQPQVPLRLPCYDFTPVADPTVVGCLLLRG